jgi:hypothetical protein
MILTHDFSLIQMSCPLAFEGMIKEIFEFSIQVMGIDWKRSCPPKCAMLMLNNNINTYEYVTNPQTSSAMMLGLEKLGIDPAK